LDQLIEIAEEKGILIVSSSGNDSFDNNDFQPNYKHYPSSFNQIYDNVISVASFSENSLEVASFSNFGKKQVDLATYGENILSTYKDGSFAKVSGTSMAAGYITRAAALHLANHNNMPNRDYIPTKNCIINNANNHSIISNKTVGPVLNMCAVFDEAECN